MTQIQKIDKIREALEKVVRPHLQSDGGDCELIDVDGNTVYVQFKGHCSGCAFSELTLVQVVEKQLKERVSQDLVVKKA